MHSQRICAGYDVERVWQMWKHLEKVVITRPLFQSIYRQYIAYMQQMQQMQTGAHYNNSIKAHPLYGSRYICIYAIWHRLQDLYKSQNCVQKSTHKYKNVKLRWHFTIFVSHGAGHGVGHGVGCGVGHGFGQGVRSVRQHRRKCQGS